VRGEPGWEIIPSRAAPGEPIIDKPGKGSFCATTSNCCCARAAGAISVLSGITTDVCVHTTMREANDRGFECVLLETVAPRPTLQSLAAVKMIKMQGGVFGAVSNSRALVENLP